MNICVRRLAPPFEAEAYVRGDAGPGVGSLVLSEPMLSELTAAATA